MKMNLVMLVCAVSSLLLFIGCRALENGGTVKQRERKITYLKYEKKGMRSDLILLCELSMQKDGSYIATYQDYKMNKSTRCPSSIGDEINNYLQEGRIDKYKDYYSPGRHVLDGNTWHFEVKYSDGNSVKSGGRVKKPKNFTAVESTIDRIKQAVSDQ